MSNNVTPITITILGKDYKIACAVEEQSGLMQSARQLDAQMRNIRDSGKVSGADRIAVMAALNLAHELHIAENKNQQLERDLTESLKKMSHKIENVLENPETR
ncbi:MAG: cell division protein ZapA [Gammaproteobacteria bacterium HGW-Gammaproteobacteria-10]|nr:MAG: cell division protein ZapA [Gammaproteobacteria bacterium HGW-Gammaproteobacteria-3]PKM35637.1 MAG: cell division protein ZapA [Gammaproteobacteria bacterium HGW-Gammaproteobacteria-10]